MANLSYFSNSIMFNPSSSFQQAENLDYLSGFDSNLLLFDTTTFVDPFLHNGLHFSPSEDPYNSFNKYFPLEQFDDPFEFEFSQCQKFTANSDYYCSNPNLSRINDHNSFFTAAGGSNIPNPLPLSTLSSNCDHKLDNGKKTSSCSSAGAGAGAGAGAADSSSNLSSQSIAARQRRRKITNKTQELGKLIPGAHKMNTAQMLQAAFKYVKFLQAQVALLQSLLTSSIHQGAGEEALMQSQQQLQNLLASQAIQEKLYSEEKCLVPKHFLQALVNDYQIDESKPLIIEDINRLLLIN
ncbi:hypothetical protein CCACVL1_11537 [Corchorus capsularis]|uniref:BHLH domain-containing protein n=1 Tax=Corchorus capsularis TaxID=210143 RepID=A0A1R3IKS6_COCAP|nr:hypothetical protein CCACVL1_11537 [Corchorus capsularis]